MLTSKILCFYRNNKNQKFILYILLFWCVFTNSTFVLAQKFNNSEFLIANNYFAKNKYLKALMIYIKLVKQDNENPELHLMLAKCYNKISNQQLAFDHYTMAIKYGNLESKYYYERGLFLQQYNNLIVDAIDNFTMAKNYSLDDSITFNSLYHRGECRSSIRDFVNAKSDFLNANKIYTSKPFLLNDLAMCCSAMGNNDTAIVLLKQLIQIDSQNTYGYQNLGFIMANMEKFEEALVYFDLCFNKEASPNALLYNNRGYVYYKLKNYKKALKDVNKSLKLLKTNSYAYRNKALIYIDLNENDKVCKNIEKALKYNFTQRYGNEILELKKKYCNY